MDRGVKFVLDNFNKTLDFINNNPEYEKYKKKVQIEYSRIKYIKYIYIKFWNLLEITDFGILLSVS